MKTENEKPSNPTIQEGWTLRDEIANSAMQGLLIQAHNIKSTNGKTLGEYISELAYGYADNMLKQREL